MAAARAADPAPPAEADPPYAATMRAVADMVRAYFPDAADIRIVYSVPDGAGGRTRGAIPVTAVRPAGGGGLSARKQLILRRVAESPVPLTRKQLARQCGSPTAKGSFGQDVRELVAAGKLYASMDEVTDDPAKFKRPTD